MEKILKEFGLKLKLERIKNGLSQEKLAEIVGVSTRSISMIETGAQQPKFFLVAKIAKNLNFDINTLID